MYMVVIAAWWLGSETFEELLILLQEARLGLGEILSAVEFMDSEAMRLVTTYLDLSNPIADHPFYMLIETSGTISSLVLFLPKYLAEMKKITNFCRVNRGIW